MKVFVSYFMDEYCSGGVSDVGFVVHDSFDILEERELWYRTWKPLMVKNQYGEFPSKTHKRQSMTFEEWMASKYEKCDIVADDC